MRMTIGRSFATSIDPAFLSSNLDASHFLFLLRSWRARVKLLWKMPCALRKFFPISFREFTYVSHLYVKLLHDVKATLKLLQFVAETCKATKFFADLERKLGSFLCAFVSEFMCAYEKDKTHKKIECELDVEVRPLLLLRDIGAVLF